MKKVAFIVASILIPIGAVFLTPVSDVQGGAALLPAGPLKASPVLTATIVVDVTADSGKGNSSVTVQKGSEYNRSALFQSSYVNSMTTSPACPTNNPATTTWTTQRFLGPAGVPGYISTFIDDPAVLKTLFAGNAGDAAITVIDNIACTTVSGRSTLSFTAVIQYVTKSQK